jgi:hypothetical protein
MTTRDVIDQIALLTEEDFSKKVEIKFVASRFIPVWIAGRNTLIS